MCSCDCDEPHDLADFEPYHDEGRAYYHDLEVNYIDHVNDRSDVHWLV